MTTETRDDPFAGLEDEALIEEHKAHLNTELQHRKLRHQITQELKKRREERHA